MKNLKKYLLAFLALIFVTETKFYANQAIVIGALSGVVASDHFDIFGMLLEKYGKAYNLIENPSESYRETFVECLEKLCSHGEVKILFSKSPVIHHCATSKRIFLFKEDFEKLSKEEQKFVIAHFVEHIRHKDFSRSILQKSGIFLGLNIFGAFFNLISEKILKDQTINNILNNTLLQAVCAIVVDKYFLSEEIEKKRDTGAARSMKDNVSGTKVLNQKYDNKDIDPIHENLIRMAKILLPNQCFENYFRKERLKSLAKETVQ